MIRLALLAITLLVSACASRPISPSEARPVSSSNVYSHEASTATRTVPVTLTRDAGVNGKGCTVALSVDGEKAADIDTGETVTLWMAPGEHIVSGSNNAIFCRFGVVETLVNLTDGEPMRLRISLSRASELSIGRTTY